MKSKNSVNQPVKKRGRGRPKKTRVIEPEDLDKGMSESTAVPKRKPKHYIDNAEFERLIREYYRTDVFSEELGEMINKISEHVTYMPRFINYCVDELTEAKTQRGWLKYNEISVSDKILAYDCNHKSYQWSGISEIFINGIKVSFKIKR
jgi:hypothetical protein